MGGRAVKHKEDLRPGFRPGQIPGDDRVGRVLATARRQKGLTIEETAKKLKISAKQIAGLEEGDLSVFSAEVYARGAFNKYADWLGVRNRDLTKAWTRSVSSVREHVALRVHTPKPWLAAIMTPRIVLVLLGIGLAGLVGSYVVVQVAGYVWLPSLEIQVPGRWNQRELVIEGQASRVNEVRVNEEQVIVAADGSFSRQVSLSPGVNVIQVEAINSAGRRRTVTKSVLRPRG